VGTGADEVEKLALADPVIAPHLAGKSIVKRIFRAGQIIESRRGVRGMALIESAAKQAAERAREQEAR